MPRGPRLDASGALHHVIARGIERRDIFLCDADRTDFLRRLGGVTQRGGTSVYAWCLMDNHFHLLLRTGPRLSLSATMRRLLTGYAVAFNLRHRRAGHLFQNRFRSTIVEEDVYLLTLVRYIHLNPLKAHKLPDIAALDAYPWSGHAGLLGDRPQPWHDVDFVLRHFGREPKAACRAYREFVLAGLSRLPDSDLDGGGLRRSCGGWESLERLDRGRERWLFDERVLGTSEFVAGLAATASDDGSPAQRPAEIGALLNQITATAASRHAVAAEEIRGQSRRRCAAQARALVAHDAVRKHGIPIVLVARFLRVTPSCVLRALERHTVREG